MIKLNMSDVISVLNMCKPYLIAIAVILVVGIVAKRLCARKWKIQKENLSEEMRFWQWFLAL